jgi:hypothetical protein
VDAVDTNRRAPTAALPATPVALEDNVAALDAALTDADWPLVQRLWRLGLTNAGIYRLLRLRLMHRHRDQENDGLETDPRLEFARWLVAHGRLDEGI